MGTQGRRRLSGAGRGASVSLIRNRRATSSISPFTTFRTELRKGKLTKKSYLRVADCESSAYNRLMDSEITIVFEPAEEGGFTAFIPEVPGAVSEGETVEEAREMVLDALHELTAYRRDQALRAKGPKTLIERIAPVF